MRNLGICTFLIGLLAVVTLAPAHAYEDLKPSWTTEDTQQVLTLAKESRSLFSDKLNDYPSARFR
jgi:hypothetical protein